MIRVEGVSKSFGSTVALDEVSFGVDRNQILGFLGPNGAGKSTAMRIITTFLSPDAGRVTVDGVDVARNPLAVRNRIGYLPETAPLYDEMRTIEYLEFVAKARGLHGAKLKQRLEWIYDAASIREVLYKTVSALSRGFRQRVGLAQALVHDPDILILDEPTTGLDPRQIIDIRNLIRELANKKTIIFSTHILAEVSAVTNRIAIINEGRIVADGHVDELRRRAMKSNRYVVELSATGEEPLQALKTIPGIASVEVTRAKEDNREAVLLSSPMGRDVRREINEMARTKGWDLLELRPVTPTLEEAFIALTGREVARP